VFAQHTEIHLFGGTGISLQSWSRCRTVDWISSLSAHR